jgi:hypothetical protein
MSGAALFCGDLLTGVMAVDLAKGQHAHLEAVPAHALLRDPAFRQILDDHGGTDLTLEPVEAQTGRCRAARSVPGGAAARPPAGGRLPGP